MHMLWVGALPASYFLVFKMLLELLELHALVLRSCRVGSFKASLVLQESKTCSHARGACVCELMAADFYV